MLAEIRIGCCGFPVGFKKYFSEFNLVEIQKTFYYPPENKILENWRNKVPSDFEFTVKAWQLITHPESSPTYKKLKAKIKIEAAGFFKDNELTRYGYKRTIEVAKILRAKVILFQSPPSFKQDETNITNLRNFFIKIAKDDFKFLWEPRGKWDFKIVKNLSRELGFSLAIDPFKVQPFPQEVIYFRLHGIGGYRYKYKKSELKELLKMIKGLKFKICYLLFNNTYMWDNALEFKELIC